MTLTDYGLDRSVFSVVSLEDPPDEPAYWQTRTPAERLQAMEWMRRVNFGHQAATARIRGVLEIGRMEIKP